MISISLFVRFSDTYDCIGVSGGMGESHLPRAALSEMIRIVKPGSQILFKVQIVANYKDVCLQNTSKSHSYHLKIWRLL